MGSIIGSCCGSMFAGLCCGACAQCKPAKSGPTSRLPYLFLLILSGIFATFMSIYGEKEWDLELTSLHCPGCNGNGSVFRVSLCLFLFEVIHVLFIGLGAVSFHWLWFAIKFMIYVGCVIITFFYGTNKFYSNFGQFSRYGPSPIYLILQILILINCGYVLNDTFKRKGNQGYKIYWWFLGGGSALMYITSITILILSYIYYAGNKCNTHNAIITIAFVLVILCCGLSIWIANGTFFASSIVALYIAYLTVSGLQSSEGNQCNELHTEKDSYTWVWIGVSVALATLVYAGLRSNLLAEFFQQPEDYNSIEEPLLENSKQENKDIETTEGEDNDKSNYDENNEKIKKSNYNDPELESNNGDNESSSSSLTVKKEAVSFHIIMALASAYMAMLLTNWGTAKGNIATTGTASMWVNVVCSWVAAILFFWTLLAPKLCPGRFDTEDDDE